MERLVKSGKIEEIYYARLLPGEDILLALYEICAKNDIKTGVILDGSGSCVNFTYQHFPINPKFVPTNVTIGVMEGKCELSIRGTIGTTVCSHFEGTNPDDAVAGMFPTIPDFLETNTDEWHMIGSMAGHGTPYIHAHCVGTNKDYTVCGHLMPGTKVASGDPEKPSHFTVVIARVSGLEWQAVVDDKNGFYQNIAETK